MQKQQGNPRPSTMASVAVQAAMATANKAAGIKFTGPLLWKVTYKRCAKHTPPNVRQSAQVLGLRKLNHSVVVKNVRPVRGLLHVVRTENFLAGLPCPAVSFFRFLILA